MAAATVGGVAGALVLYWLGYDRLHRLAGRRWFFLASLPAGITGMPLPRFLALTTAGTAVWNAVFIAAGWFLAEKWHRVDAYMGPVGVAVLGSIVVGLGILAWRRHRQRARRAASVR